MKTQNNFKEYLNILEKNLREELLPQFNNFSIFVTFHPMRIKRRNRFLAFSSIEEFKKATNLLRAYKGYYFITMIKINSFLIPEEEIENYLQIGHFYYLIGAVRKNGDKFLRFYDINLKIVLEYFTDGKCKIEDFFLVEGIQPLLEIYKR